MRRNYRPDRRSAELYQAELVEVDIELGRRILEALAHAHIPVSAALWLFVPQLGEWHLMIATSLVDRKGPRTAYGELWTILQKHQLLPQLPLRRIYLLSPKTPFVSALRSTLRTMLPGRLRSAYLGDRFIEDAYVYPVPSNR